MNKQISFNYKFVEDNNEHNYFVNTTNVYAFNGLFKFDNNLLFLYGPRKSGKTYLSQIWLKKNNAIEFENNFEILLNSKHNILIDDLSFSNEENIFHIVNNSILNNTKILITSNKKIQDINFIYKVLEQNIS